MRVVVSGASLPIHSYRPCFNNTTHRFIKYEADLLCVHLPSKSDSAAAGRVDAKTPTRSKTKNRGASWLKILFGCLLMPFPPTGCGVPMKSLPNDRSKYAPSGIVNGSSIRYRLVNDRKFDFHEQQAGGQGIERGMAAAANYIGSPGLPVW